MSVIQIDISSGLELPESGWFRPVKPEHEDKYLSILDERIEREKSIPVPRLEEVTPEVDSNHS